MEKIHIIGGGMAGCEAAWQLLSRNIPVVLHEMRPTASTAAHQTDKLGELVCSNSFRSDDVAYNAVGLLHEEMRKMGSLVMACGAKARVPAGGAMAVDREEFADLMTESLVNHPLLQIERGAINHIDEAKAWPHCIIATGPLTSDSLARSISDFTGNQSLAFFDAIAPIVYKDSINMDICWFQSRYDKSHDGGDGKDYINCPMTEAQYNAFIAALLAGEKTSFHEWEKDTPYFEACLPIEVMAERGPETLRFGPMKPVGLTNPHDSSRPYAVVQLRQDNKLGTLYNIVGFQTKLRYGAQTEIFRMIPGLENVEFARLGGIHRNSFIHSPSLLDSQLRLKKHPTIRFAGQITGVEGYVESAATGIMAGRMAAAEILGENFTLPPATTAIGALLHHITEGAEHDSFQPMNVNFGLFPPPPPHQGKGRPPKGRDRKKLYTDRALADMQHWLEQQPNADAA